MAGSGRSTNGSPRAGAGKKALAAFAALLPFVILGGAACGKSLTLESDDASAPTNPPLTNLPDASDFPEGSVILLDGAVILPDGAVVDGAAADAGDDAASDQFVPPACPGAAACARVVFVTSDLVDPLVADPVAGAAHCDALAAASPHAAVMGRHFEAWTSTTSSPATLRLVHGTMPYKDVSGAVIAASWADLTDGVLTKSIFRDEKGGTVGAGELVWTGTNAPGNFLGPNCSEWKAKTGTATRGVVGATNQNWTAFTGSDADCGGTAHLYCVEK